MNSRRIACLALALGSLCAGCSDDDGADSPPPSTDASSDSFELDSVGSDAFGDSSADSSNNDAAVDVGVDIPITQTGAWADGILTTAELFDGNLIDTISIEVDFEEGAEPHNGSGSLDWSYTRQSLARVFQESGAQVLAPSTLFELESFIVEDEDFGDAYSKTEIATLSALHRDVRASGTTANFHVLYLDGYFEENDETKLEVLGVSLRNQRIVAIFKPALESVKTVTALQRGFVEEATLVHELGHALGLVGLPEGVPMVEDHEDADHPGHDVDDACIMHWSNERSSDVLSFVLSILIGSDKRVLFCDASLRDVDAVSTPAAK